MLAIFFQASYLSDPKCFAESIRISRIHSGCPMLHLTLKHVEMITAHTETVGADVSRRLLVHTFSLFACSPSFEEAMKGRKR